MEKIKVDGSFLKALINNSKTDFNNLIENFEIEINDPIEFDISEKSFTFINCSFKGEKIKFFQGNYLKTIEVTLSPNEERAHKSRIEFRNCVFKNDLEFLQCKLDSLKFYEVSITSKLFILANLTVKHISINGTSGNYNTINSLSLILIKDNLSFNFNNNIITSLDVSFAYITQFWITDNEFGNFNISDSYINDIFLLGDKIKNKSGITKSEIKRINSTFSVFEKDFEFKDCLFKDEILFEKTKNSDNSSVNFTNINFESRVSFEFSKLSYLKFESVYFKEIVSFQMFECDKIELNKTHFDKVGFFNDLIIKSPAECSLSTIRTIKNQLFKTENKIDYARFNNIEMNILIKDKSTRSRDLILLLLNKNSNDFGTDWAKGIGFTFKISLFFFALLLIVNNFLKSNYPLTLNTANEFADFSFILNYFLKFIFNLGFNDNEIQSNGWLYLIFIFAKLFIGYGIYQTIQAFRKYGK